MFFFPFINLAAAFIQSDLHWFPVALLQILHMQKCPYTLSLSKFTSNQHLEPRALNSVGRCVCVCVYKSAGMHTSTWSEEERFLSSSLSLTQLASTTSNNTSIQNQREWALVLFSSFMTSSIIPIKQVMPKLYFSYDMNASQMHSFSKFTLLKVFKLSCVECLCLRAHYQMKFDCVFVSWQVYFRKISPYVHYVHTICVTQCTQNFNECYMNVRTTFLK